MVSKSFNKVVTGQRRSSSAQIAILLFPNTPVIAMRAASEWAPCRREGPAGRIDLITQTQQPPAIEELLPPPPASIQKKDAKAETRGKEELHPQPSPFLPHTFQRIKPRRRTRPLVRRFRPRIQVRNSEVSELFLGSEKCALQLGFHAGMV